ncbi:MAG: hypothetical protein IJQ11_09525 [Bacteroidales bacterium]|nr:hypothetical protein [Bacteroidales bacterium]
MKQPEGKIFNLKPEMTLAMKLAATFAITYYGLLLVFEILVVVFRRYYFDALYLNQEELTLNSRDFVYQIIQLVLSVVLVFSLIQIFRKKVNGKLIFVAATLVLIVFQFIATGPIPILKYILELLMLFFIAPLRVKKKIRMKDGKLKLENVESSENTALSSETT